MIRLSTILGLILLFPCAVQSQSLQARLDALTPGQWLSYEVPMQPGVRAPCCYDWRGREVRNGLCRLDENNWNFGHHNDDPVAAVGASLRVLLRRDVDGFDRIRAVGSHCPVDATGTEVVEIGDTMSAAQSAALLASALDRGTKHERHFAIAAIAHHDGAAADRIQEGAAAPTRTRTLRRDAVFWQSQARGEHGFDVVRGLLQQESADALRRHAVFALSISPVAGAATELRRFVRQHPEPDVRAEAIFWLAQNGDVDTEAVVKSVLSSETSSQVRDKAVFALSQLPPERAVPALRRLIAPDQPRELRRQALFWLAQLDDEAAFPVFDELLGVAR
jgi:hypothetical protein